MLANLLHVAGIKHVITIDLHASQMQGFFKCPVDNLHAEPLIARWIRHNVLNWQEAVCVSKNAGGTKRVTSLADALKLNFGIVTTDKKRGGGNMSASLIMNRLDGLIQDTDLDSDVSKLHIGSGSHVLRHEPKLDLSRLRIEREEEKVEEKAEQTPQEITPPRQTHSRQDSQSSPRKSQHNMPSPRRTAHNPTSNPTLNPATATRSPLHRAQSTPARSSPIQEEPEFTDERARDIIHGRLVQGHIVPDDYPSPTQSAMSSSMILERPDEDPMEMSRNSSFFNPEGHALGGTADATATSDEEEEGFNDPTLEQMITLVGDVRNRTVFIVDDMIDKAGSWIAAAECVVKRGGAKKVYCIATHGLFGGDSLEELQGCDCIDTVLVTNSFPISPEKARATKKLVILDLSNLLAEAIRRNHYGESISALFTHTYD
jgi:ribose-phosphate pyrophosphokinase